MKKLLFIPLLFLCLSMLLLNGNWQPVPNTRVNFTIDGLFGKDVKGTIAGLDSEIDFYPEDLQRSSIKASISPSTINTGINKRDAHLRTADFLDVTKYPQISFTSKSFRKVGEYYVVEGDLKLKDVSQSITIPFEFTEYGDSARFNGDFTINRLNYHVGKQSMLMGNEVRIHLDIPVIKK